MIDQTAASEAGADTLSILILAVVQGLAEFLPISSSGHLALLQLAMNVDVGLAFDVALHLGTLGAVLWFYRADVLVLLRETLAGRFYMALWLIVATIPVGVVGVLAKDLIGEAKGNPLVVSGGLFFTACVLIVAEVARRRGEPRLSSAAESCAAVDLVEDPPSMRDALYIGCAQVAAILPGISRSGTTIAAGMLRGMAPARAARLSFLMSIPAISGAAIFMLKDVGSESFGSLSTGLVCGAMVLSGVVGWLALATLMLTMKRGSLPWFAGYCAILAAVVIALS